MTILVNNIVNALVYVIKMHINALGNRLKKNTHVIDNL